MTYRTNDTLWLKAAGFGLARLLEAAGHSGITGTGEICGTLAYLSPEQLMDSRSAKPESDVYATVVRLFRLLTGEYPYRETFLADSLQRRMSEEARAVTTLNPHVPADLAAVFQQGLLREFAKQLIDTKGLTRMMTAVLK